MKKLLKVVVRKRDRQVFVGNATAVTAYNRLGEFDVLSNHANMVAKIKDKVIVRNNRSKREFKIEEGILSVKENEVNVFLGI